MPADTSISTLVKRFNNIATRFAQTTACSFDHMSLSYEELDNASDSLAHYLVTQGACLGHPMGVLLERSPAAIVTFLAAAKAGIPYVPLALDWPRKRTGSLLKRLGVTILVAAPDTPAGISHYEDIKTITYSVPSPPFPPAPFTSPVASMAASPAVSPNGYIDQSKTLPLYILHTSGSTGTPKAVAVSHANVLHFSNAFCAEAFTPGCRVAFCGALTFDASVMEIWASLLNGCTIVGGETKVILDANLCRNFLTRNNINTMFLATAAFNALALQNPAAFASLDYLFAGGEQPSLQIFNSVFSATPPKHFFHVYGPTETTVIIAKHELTSRIDEAIPLPVGTLINGASAHILDEQGQPLPVNTPGEIFLGGPTVSIGYMNDPERTAQAYIESPASPGEKLYRTGDIGKLEAHGVLTILGRVDDQVKISGYRVNLSEISSIARKISKVGLAHVEYEPLRQQLVIFVVPQTESSLTEMELHAALKESLPPYMLPDQYVFLLELPVNQNGKIDRGRLPWPDGAPSSSLPDLPGNPEHSGSKPDSILEICRKFLNHKDFNKDSSFLACGGTSLKAANLIAAIRNATGFMVPLELFYQPKTVSSIELFLELAGKKLSDATALEQTALYDEVII